MQRKRSKPVLKGGKINGFTEMVPHGRRRLLGEFTKAAKMDLAFFRKQGWLDVLRQKLDSIIEYLADTENLNRIQAIREIKKGEICPTKVFAVKIGKQWYAYSLQLDLKQGLFFHREKITKKAAESMGSYSDTRAARYARKKHWLEKIAREKNAGKGQPRIF